MKAPRRKLLLIGALLVLSGVAGLSLFRMGRGDGKLNLETVSADRGPVVAKVTANGALSALVTVQVGSQVSGTLQTILVDFNSPVKKGQEIARIDPRLFQASLEQARANHDAARANLVKAEAQAADAERQFGRARQLLEAKIISQAEVDTAQAASDQARAQVEAARGSVEQMKAALNQAEVNLAYTTIASPIDGVVISRNVDVGQTVAASLQAPTLFVIAEDLRRMQVDTSVAEADIGKLRAGMAASFSVDAYPEKRFEGTVRQIRNAPQVQQNVVTYDVVVDVENPEHELKPGMTASVVFVHAERKDALRVPNAALRFRPSAEELGRLQAEDGGSGVAFGIGSQPTAGAAPSSGGPGRPQGGSDRRTVWALAGGKARQVPILIGITDGAFTEVVQGNLRPGDLLITDASDEAPQRKPASRGGSQSLHRLF